MNNIYFFSAATFLTPACLMLLAAISTRTASPENIQTNIDRAWRWFSALAILALVATIASAAVHSAVDAATLDANSTTYRWLLPTQFAAYLAVLAQFLGMLIGRFSARYLEGEQRQTQYIRALAGVLTAVHVLLIANHWLVFIGAWALVGWQLQALLCFYPDRPFALLAAHKKRLADRLADLLLIIAAAFAWHTVGDGSFTALWNYLQTQPMNWELHLSALGVVLAVVLRTALLPIHGWLIQVMEAPTPVSALLHAGVVNLGGLVLIRFAPLLENAAPARALLVLLGLNTAILAGLVMLTRISIKVRLAWSTVAQMGFMVLECGLGLYSLAALHLIGHSLYKAHQFLSASSVVRDTRLQTMRGNGIAQSWSLLSAPLLSIALVIALVNQATQWTSHASWPWWWSVILGLAWAPLLWNSRAPTSIQKPLRHAILQLCYGIVFVLGLTSIALLGHRLPLGLSDTPHDTLGVIASLGMAALYLMLICLQMVPQHLSTWRRWSYAGFYVDEFYTRLTLRLWPTQWMTSHAKRSAHAVPTVATSH